MRNLRYSRVIYKMPKKTEKLKKKKRKKTNERVENCVTRY